MFRFSSFRYVSMLQSIAQNTAVWKQGYFSGACSAFVFIVAMWSAVLMLQIWPTQRRVVESTYSEPLPTFPSTSLVVVSKLCANGLPPVSAQWGRPPTHDFAFVVGMSTAIGGEAIVRLRRPAFAKTRWEQVRYSKESNAGQGSLSCAFTVAAFSLSNAECFTRFSVGDQGWNSDESWHFCKDSEAGPPFSPLAGMNAGNWTTTEGLKPAVQRVPSWPSESFFIIPCLESEANEIATKATGVLRQILRQPQDFDTPLILQESLSARFQRGAWLFQASNSDPFANIGPLRATFQSTRCEGECDAHRPGQKQQLSVSVKSVSPRWRQPLCEPDLKQESAHQGCVPIVFVADTNETVIVGTVGITLPNLLVQWLTPVVAFLLLLPFIFLFPFEKCHGYFGSFSESSDLISDNGFDSDPHEQVIGNTRVPQLDDDV